MSTLDRLEKTAGISVFNKLVPKFLSMASALCFDESTLDSLREENNPVEGVKEMVKAWLSGKNFLPPMSTWQVLLEKLQAVGMGELAQEIEHFFNRMSVTSPSASLVSHVRVYPDSHWYTLVFDFFFLIDIRQQESRTRTRLVCN